MEFLEFKEKSETISQPISSLGEKLQQIRDKIVASGTPLLTEDEIEKEVAERRGGSCIFSISGVEVRGQKGLAFTSARSNRTCLATGSPSGLGEAA